MYLSAKAKYVRCSPKKAVLVGRAIKRMPVEKALGVLRFLNKGASSAISKVVHSAAANAKNVAGVTQDNLIVKEVRVDKAPTMRRIWTRGQGRADRIAKRMSHITVTLDFNL